MKKNNKLFAFIKGLNTIEKKSFWIVAIMVFLIAVVSLISGNETFENNFYRVGGWVCVIFPLAMMIACYFSENYHICYPLLSIGIGSVCIPLTFLSNGGFYSGMPLMCLGATVMTAFVYDRKWRIISFAVTVVGNLFVFWVSKKGFGSVVTVKQGWFENDITLCYVLSSVGLFAAVNLLLNEARHLVTDSEVLEKVMDASVRREIIEKENKGALNYSGTRTRVTVLFIDISRFTSTTEKMTPEKAAEYLNTFLSIVDRCIHENSGILDKFIGDCAMAYWLDPDKNGKGVYSAVNAVFDAKKEIYARAEEIFDMYHTELDFSAGIDYGDAVIGSIGSEKRKDFTIIGDAVNTASRLQSIAARGELLISDRVYEFIKDSIDALSVNEDFYLRGKNTPLKIYHVNHVLNNMRENRNLGNVKSERYKDGFLLHVCGCRGSFPVSGMRYAEFGGETSCYIIKKGSYALIVDCGSGLGNAKQILKDCEKIDILLTHVHYDHIIGLLNMSVFPKKADITMYGHFGGWCGMDTINDFLGSPYWPVNLINIKNVDVMLGLEYKVSNEIFATFYKADHPNNGTLIKLEIEKKKVCVFADLEDPSYIDPRIAFGSDILLYDGMYDDADQKKHAGWGHSTWQEAARYADAEKVKRLVITHHNPEYADHALLQREGMAKEIFANSIFARTGDVYTI